MSKYLVRPSDMEIFVIDESNGCYKIYSGDDSSPQALSYFTFDNLTKNYNFFPIDERDVSIYKYFSNIYIDYISWACRSNGHGGVKGGTFEEYLQYIGR